MTLGVKPVFDMSATSYDDVINLVASGQDDLAVAGFSPTLIRARLKMNLKHTLF